jgi:ABC-type dipeptide/oligopeptide/nickel transport system ATPase subunit
MRFIVEVTDVRPIRALRFDIDLDRNQPTCIVGKNGSGKTTLAKAVMNFALADTFKRTTSAGVLQRGSTVRYTFGNDTFLFTFDPVLVTLNTRTPIPEALKSLIAVELPIPHGHRFHYFRTLSEADDDVRRAIILGQHHRPDELIGFLTRIYGDNRFEDLIEVQLRGSGCCCLIEPDGRYLREDYFSSGEYFLISLYRRILQGKRLVFIDEIDISLDAAAQARLVGELRALCTRHSVNVVFTSHSLAMMQTLNPAELIYMERTAEGVSLTPVSFSYVKSLMFGFAGRDRYILTEDQVLNDFLEYVIRRYCSRCFYSYHVIEIGGGGQVVDLMRRNARDAFFGSVTDVIAVLDGDESEKRHAKSAYTYCIPLQSVEKALWDEYQKPEFQPRVDRQFPNAKALFKHMIRSRILSREEIFKLLCDRHEDHMRAFAAKLEGFLCRSRIDGSVDDARIPIQ